MRCLAGVLYLAAVTTAHAANPPLPRAPDRPTPEDCRRLDAAFFDIVRGLHQRQQACMRAPPQFGAVALCRGPGVTMSAWVQCAPIDHEICRTEEAQSQQVQLCRSRVHGPAATARGLESREAWLRAGNATYAEVESAYATARSLTHYLADPAGFLWDSLAPFDATRTLVFGPNDAQFNNDAAQEVLTIAFRTVNGTLARSTSDPIVRGVQSDVMSHLERQLRAIMAESSRLTLAIDNFEIPAGLLTSRASPLPAARVDPAARLEQALADWEQQAADASFRMQLEEETRARSNLHEELRALATQRLDSSHSLSQPGGDEELSHMLGTALNAYTDRKRAYQDRVSGRDTRKCLRQVRTHCELRSGTGERRECYQCVEYADP